MEAFSNYSSDDMLYLKRRLLRLWKLIGDLDIISDGFSSHYIVFNLLPEVSALLRPSGSAFFRFP